MNKQRWTSWSCRNKYSFINSLDHHWFTFSVSIWSVLVQKQNPKSKQKSKEIQKTTRFCGPDKMVTDCFSGRTPPSHLFRVTVDLRYWPFVSPSSRGGNRFCAGFPRRVRVPQSKDISVSRVGCLLIFQDCCLFWIVFNLFIIMNRWSERYIQKLYMDIGVMKG